MLKVDKKIIEGLKRKDEQAFEDLFKIYHKKIHQLVYSYVKNSFECEDVEQEIYIRVLNKIHLYDEEKAPFSSWILKLAKNYTINYMKSKQHHPVIYSDEYVGNYMDEKVQIHLDLFFSEIQKELTPIEYRILILKIIQKMNYKELSLYFNISIYQCKKLYHRAYQKAKIKVEEKNKPFSKRKQDHLKNILLMLNLFSI